MNIALYSWSFHNAIIRYKYENYHITQMYRYRECFLIHNTGNCWLYLLRTQTVSIDSLLEGFPQFLGKE